MAIIQKVLNFIKRDVWRIRAKNLPQQTSFWLRQLRVFLLAIRGFGEDKCQLRASALTFYSLLSIVPIVAMAFGVAKGFGFEKLLEKLLLEKLPGQEEVIGQVIAFAQNFLENTKGGVIAGIGVAMLFWTVIKVLGNIENSFNDIWGIKRARSIGRKFSDYLSIMLICPMLLIMSSSVTVMISSQVKLVMDKIAILGVFSPVILLMLKLLPFCVLWVLFTYIYIIMPNTKVNFVSGLMGGIIGGTIYQVVQWIYITFQVGVAKVGAIYGSFAALPLFLVWLQMSWLIVLFGAEISFAEQNVETYEFEPDCLSVSHKFRRLLTLWVCQQCVKTFVAGDEPPTAESLCHQQEIPVRLMRDILFDLTEAGVLSEVRKQDTLVPSFQPARDVKDLTVVSVLNALNEHGINEFPIASTKEYERICGNIEKLKDMFEKSPDNLALKDI